MVVVVCCSVQVIVMPVTTPHIKVNATRQFGGKVVLAGLISSAHFTSISTFGHNPSNHTHSFNGCLVRLGFGTCVM
jgi:threonine dehydratase